MERLSANEEGKRRFAAGEGGPLLLNDWLRAVFIHFRVPPAALQPHVPFELDLMLGDAFVSLVAFEIEGLRPARGPRILRRLLSPPVSGHGFLNVRTYVRSDGDNRSPSRSGCHWLVQQCRTPLGVVGAFHAPYGLPVIC